MVLPALLEINTLFYFYWTKQAKGLKSVGSIIIGLSSPAVNVKGSGRDDQRDGEK
jgi:hypothetical protein